MSRENAPGTNDQTVLVVLLSIRLVNALSVKTFFQPDEYYQALEPAWNLAFNDEHAWITWEWHQHLRSALHPALISSVYYAATKISPWIRGFDAQGDILLLAPKVLQHVIGALGDYYTWKLSYKVYGKSQLAFSTLCLAVLSPWQWFCSTRTFSNGLESTLTITALYYWPFDWTTTQVASKNKASQNHEPSSSLRTQSIGSKTWQLRRALILAALATIMRPTNILIWLSLTALAVLGSEQRPIKTPKSSKQSPSQSSKDPLSVMLVIAREGTICGLLALTFSVLIDRLYYGAWTFPPLNFFYFNVIQSLAVFYGNNDWHYYLSQGYPLLLTTALPFALVGLWRILSNSPSIAKLASAPKSSLKGLAIISVTLPAALSILSHKEVRFIYPILGPLHIIATGPLADFFGPVFNSATDNSSKTTFPRHARGLILLTLVTLNVTIAGYTTLIHNSGLIALPEYLRSEFAIHYTNTNPNTQTGHALTPQNMTVAILMPCHSIPWRSHLLNPPTHLRPGIQAWALTCEPPLHLTTPASKANYLDEADIFYADPAQWLRKTMTRRPPWTFATPPGPNGPSPPQRPPGLYTDPARNNKRLGGWRDDENNNNEHEGSTPGLDITDLLPQLRTAPDRPLRASGSGDGDVIRRRPWPHYLAFFAQLEPTMASTLQGSGYTECWRRFNSHWHDDWRRTGDIVVWCLFPERARTEGGDSGDGDGVSAARNAIGSKDKGKPKVSRGQEQGRARPETDRGSMDSRPGKQRVLRVGD